ncbi:hypothetical protein COO60DRAFT_265987 [Scenedesmus sp. NREL 46B-D3]|nr:hypothetical protein COO60DRAFT_265987 [Scenedesmus sp. NREL 46B-D3]
MGSVSHCCSVLDVVSGPVHRTAAVYCLHVLAPVYAACVDLCTLLMRGRCGASLMMHCFPIRLSPTALRSHPNNEGPPCCATQPMIDIDMGSVSHCCSVLDVVSGPVHRTAAVYCLHVLAPVHAACVDLCTLLMRGRCGASLMMHCFPIRLSPTACNHTQTMKAPRAAHQP